MFNSYIQNVAPSASISFMNKAKEMKAKDNSVVDLSGGEPDFNTPDPIVRELKKQLKNGFTHYTVGQGLYELREKITQDLQSKDMKSCKAENILVTPGGKYGIFLAIESLLNVGDEVIILKPAWVSYEPMVQIMGGVIRTVQLSYEENYELSQEKLEKAYSEKTKLIIINYPNNPTGRILSEKEKKVLELFLNKHRKVYLLSDEVYDSIIYDGKKTAYIGTCAELADRIIVVNSFSKSYAMTGWRLGYVSASKEIVNAMYKIYQHSLTCVSGFIQKAGVSAFDCQDAKIEMAKRYEKRRNEFVGVLKKTGGISCRLPEGAFYAWVRFNLKELSTEEICTKLLNEAKVVGVPGSAYGGEEQFIRFSFAAPDEELAVAVERIRLFVNKNVVF